MKTYIIILLAILSAVAVFGLQAKHTPVTVIIKKPAVRVVDQPIKSEKIYKIRYIADKEEVKLIAERAAKKYGVNPEGFTCMTMKESGLDGKRLNSAFKCGDGGASCGLTQIQCPTWQSMRNKMGKDPDCSYIFDDYENLETAAYGVSTYWPLHWTGYRLCVAEGYSF